MCADEFGVRQRYFYPSTIARGAPLQHGRRLLWGHTQGIRVRLRLEKIVAALMA
jgi:hypothetical protein